MSISQETKTALISAIQGLVARLQETAGLSEQEVNDLISQYVTGIIADDAAAGVGTSETLITSVKGAGIVATKILTDALAGNPAGLQSLLDIGNAIAANQGDITDLTDTLASFVNVFNYVGEVSGGVDDQTPFDLATLPEGGKDSGDYYDVAVGGWFIIAGIIDVPFEVPGGNGIVFKADGTIKVFDNQLTNVQGTANEITVTGNKEVGFTVALAQIIKDRITALENAEIPVPAPVDWSAPEQADIISCIVPPTVAADVFAVEPGIYQGAYDTSDLAEWLPSFDLTGTLSVQVTALPGSLKLLYFKFNGSNLQHGATPQEIITANFERAMVFDATSLQSDSNWTSNELLTIGRETGVKYLAGVNPHDLSDVLTTNRFAAAFLSLGEHNHLTDSTAVGLDGDATVGILTTTVLGTAAVKRIAQKFTFAGGHFTRFADTSVEDGGDNSLLVYSAWSGGTGSGGDDVRLAARLQVGPGEAVTVDAILTATRAQARVLPLGNHVHSASASAVGIDADTAVDGTVFTTIISTAAGAEVVLNQTFVWLGKSATRSADSAIEDAGAVTVLQWTQWNSPTDEISDLYTLLTETFDGAAQPVIP